MRYWGDIEHPDEDELGERGDLPDVRPNNTSLRRLRKRTTRSRQSMWVRY